MPGGPQIGGSLNPWGPQFGGPKPRGSPVGERRGKPVQGMPSLKAAQGVSKLKGTLID